MKSESTTTLDVTILDREFRVACSEEERPGLLDAVTYLDKKMHEIRDIGKVVTTERIAIMAALNIAHELLTTPLGEGFNRNEFERRINQMETIIDSSLSEQDELF